MDARISRPKFMQRKLDEDIDKEFASCNICGKPLHRLAKYYCSGICLNEAKKRGLYDKEEN
jgi:hypothetical protein